MPSRRHQSNKPTKPAGGSPGARSAPATGAADTSSKDPAAMFAAALKETEARDEVQREKDRQHREAAAQKAADEQAHATSLAQARRDLDRAIAAVRTAKSNGRSTVEADAVWKAAKARVIELETGVAPAWAPSAPADESPGDGGSIDDEQS